MSKELVLACLRLCLKFCWLLCAVYFHQACKSDSVCIFVPMSTQTYIHCAAMRAVSIFIHKPVCCDIILTAKLLSILTCTDQRHIDLFATNSRFACCHVCVVHAQMHVYAMFCCFSEMCTPACLRSHCQNCTYNAITLLTKRRNKAHSMTYVFTCRELLEPVPLHVDSAVKRLFRYVAAEHCSRYTSPSSWYFFLFTCVRILIFIYSGPCGQCCQVSLP